MTGTDYRETELYSLSLSELIVRQVDKMQVDSVCVSVSVSVVTTTGPDGVAGIQHWCQDSVAVSLPAVVIGAN